MSFYRDAELQGARLLLNLHHHLLDGDSQTKLTRHLADETRHAWLWTQRIIDLGATPISIADGYQRRLGMRIGIPKGPLDLLALTLIAESRAIERYETHARKPGVDTATLAILRVVSADEPWHLAWIEEKMHEVAKARGEEDRVRKTLDTYRAIECEVYASFISDEAELMRG
jgi:bacterioferritin (cytochrome b1)